MKTTIDIPESELQDTMKYAKARTKREAVLAALTDYNRRQRMAELVRFSGTSDTLMDNTAMEALDDACLRKSRRTRGSRGRKP
ncbi:MAG: type II toxin-antitoxin system VapB family antitoxin [Acidobacteria bacterium]|nr:type II toxin-antitoxin system VapB family antitoxin [Acidobacteriota bacterium]